MADNEQAAPAPKKKKGLKIVGLAVGLLVLIGGGAGAGVYAAQSGMLSAAPHEATPVGPQLVPKSEEKRASDAGEGGEGEGGHGEAAETGGGGMPTPAGRGGDKYASNYYAMEKEFTSNLLDSVHFVQVGIAISTPYDDRVIDNLKTHEIAVRSAVLMALGETSEEQVFTVDGKRQLQARLKKAINDTLQQKEGFGGIGNVYFTNFVVQ